MDINKIKEIYGEDKLELFKGNIDIVSKNILYLKKIGIDETNELIESYAPIFLYDNNEFINKINLLIRKLGDNYIDKIYDNIGVLEELL